MQFLKSFFQCKMSRNKKYKLYIEKKIENHTTWPTKQILQDIPAKSYKFLEIPKF